MMTSQSQVNLRHTTPINKPYLSHDNSSEFHSRRISNCSTGSAGSMSSSYASSSDDNLFINRHTAAVDQDRINTYHHRHRVHTSRHCNGEANSHDNRAYRHNEEIIRQSPLAAHTDSPFQPYNSGIATNNRLSPAISNHSSDNCSASLYAPNIHSGSSGQIAGDSSTQAVTLLEQAELLYGSRCTPRATPSSSGRDSAISCGSSCDRDNIYNERKCGTLTNHQPFSNTTSATLDRHDSDTLTDSRANRGRQQSVQPSQYQQVY